jgi:hypothetical protein
MAIVVRCVIGLLRSGCFCSPHDPQVTGLRASSNNRAATVLELFLDAVGEYGHPSRVRGDRGGENVDTAVYMIVVRGPRRASFIWGPYVLSVAARQCDPDELDMHKV